jgi:hypothetical protein
VGKTDGITPFAGPVFLASQQNRTDDIDVSKRLDGYIVLIASDRISIPIYENGEEVPVVKRLKQKGAEAALNMNIVTGMLIHVL